MTDATEGVLADLLRRSHAMEPHALGRYIDDGARSLGAGAAVLYLVDLQQRELVPLGPGGEVAGEALAVDATLAGRAFISGQVLAAGPGEDQQSQLWVPLVDGTDRLGVLRLDVADTSEQFHRTALTVASLAAELLVTKGPYTDAFHRVARRQEMSLAAEMQWAMLPPLTLSTSGVAVAGVLEPAYEIGGDAFDFSINGDRLDLLILDAMGHGMSATWPAALTLGSVRHSRRSDLDLTATYRAADAALRDQFDDGRFVTAHLARLDVATGTLRWISAGHHPPLLVRGHRVVGPMSCEPSLPLGMGGEVEMVAEVSLEPGDRVLLFTDGVIETRDPTGEPFGEQRLAEVVGKAAHGKAGLAETMRQLAHAVLDHHGKQLNDDFTILLAEYRAEREASDS